MSFNDGSGAGTIVADQPMVVGSVPYALSAQKLGGLQASHVLTVGSNLMSGVGAGAALDQARLETVFSDVNYPRLLNMLSTPTSVIYGSDPGVGNRTAGQVWYNAGSNRLEYFDGTSVINLDGSGGGGAPTGAAGGDLAGTYPNPTIANSAVTTGKVADGAITADKIAAGTISLDRLAPTIYGTGAGRLMQLDGAGAIPAVDGSQATGLLRQDGSRALTGDWDVGARVVRNFQAEILSGTAASPGLNFGGASSNTGIFSPVEDQLAIATNGNEQIRIDAAGRVGIGTTAPNSELEVNGTIANSLPTGLRRTTLASALSDTATSMVLTDATHFADSGIVFVAGDIRPELISYQGRSGNTLLNLRRGVNGTNPTSFPSGNSVNGVQLALATEPSAQTEGILVLSSNAVVFGVPEGNYRPNGASLTIGHNSRADGAYSLAVGGSARALATGSIALGIDTTANAEGSIAGNRSTANAFYSTAFGRYNLVRGDSSNWVDTDPLFEIGNGADSSNRANALTVLKNGNTGVGPADPVAKLEVAGEIRTGNTGLACSASTNGSIRYNNTNSVMEFCNGSAWVLMQAPACTDTTPDAFSFSNLSNQSTSTLVESNIVQVNGMNCGINTGISGPGSPAYRICADSACASVVQDWTTGTSSITNGQYLQLRQTTAVSGGVTQFATVVAGATASAWSAATTGDCTGLPSTPPPPGTVCADGTVYAGSSLDGNVPMFTTRCDLGMTWDGANCIGSRWAGSWNNGTTNYQATGFTNSSTGRTNSAGIAGFAGTDAPYTASLNCENLIENGHTDWYLPARTELATLYDNRNLIRNFATNGTPYWSSSEVNINEAWLVGLGDGNQFGGTKHSTVFARCVRR